MNTKPHIKLDQGQHTNVIMSPGTSLNVHLPSGTIINFDVTADTLSAADQEGWIVLTENLNIGAPEDQGCDAPRGEWYRAYPQHPRREVK